LPICDQLAKSASIDVLTAVVEFSPTVVREFCLNQAAGSDDVSNWKSFLQKKDYFLTFKDIHYLS